ncbi:ComEC/Rec2 family competence protein [Clostridium sp. ZS2-4]|uniref:ComEC/Rec2 family competence protein n=1 Tax=Clostridium sp. ZS2-4 TaxID=2987703 RepID=UPI00227C1371|nr:MBL fold metallo-hydrolase [Clostridium sp. ZS2-4]MCY6353637.1 MBL fold metallo-hydrolase [Clostridium sp. ZS2-4]
MKIKMLKAFNGDSLIISFPKNKKTNYNILIDGGISRTYNCTLKKEIENIIKSEEFIDLLIITHVDDDHIGGIIKFFEDVSIDKSIVKRVVFNSAWSLAENFNTIYNLNREQKIGDGRTCTSFKQGLTLEKKLKELNLLEPYIIKALDVIEIGNAKLTILSPLEETLKLLNDNWEIEKLEDLNCSAKMNDYNKTIQELLDSNKDKNDSSLVNESSIAFLLEINEYKILMLGDAYPNSIVNTLKKLGYSNLNKLKLDYLKLSHHGSNKNINTDFLNIIECSNYFISTNGVRYNHPNKATLAKVINTQKNITFYFNYKVYEKIFKKKDYEQFEFKCIQINNEYVGESNYE